MPILSDQATLTLLAKTGGFVPTPSPMQLVKAASPSIKVLKNRIYSTFVRYVCKDLFEKNYAIETELDWFPGLRRPSRTMPLGIKTVAILFSAVRTLHG